MFNFKFLNKKILTFLMLAVLLTQTTVVLALGEECGPSELCTGDGEVCCCQTDGKGICGPTGCNIICPFSKYTSLKTFINAIVNFIFSLAVIAAPLMMVIGGFIFLTSGGNPSRTGLGKNIMKWAIIGLAVILFAWGIQGVIKYIIIGA